MEITEEKLKDLLVRPGHISEADFDGAVMEAKKKETQLEHFLVEKGFISDQNLGTTITAGN